MVKINKLIISKTIGIGAISAVMAIGFYVLILDLPNVSKNSTSVSVVSYTENDSGAEQSNSEIIDEYQNENTQTTSPDQSTISTNGTSTPSNSTPNTPTSPSAPSTNPTSPTPLYKYKDNSYTKSRTYDVVGQNLTWTLTATINIDKDIVTNVSTQQATSGQSVSYYNNFVNQLSSAVFGKKLDGLSISKLGGASYTSDAFNDILSQVRSAALK